MIHEITNTGGAAQLPAPRSCNLILHCGADAVERDQLTRTPAPPRTLTWRPVPHLEVLQTVEAALGGHGLNISGQAHGLSHEDKRYFGLLEVCATNADASYRWVVGVRNSHDKTFPAGIVAGTQVLVCDNLSFAGEISLARKHTSNILRDLPRLAWEAVSRLRGFWQKQDQRIEAYANTRLRDPDAHDLMIRAVDSGVCSNAAIPKVLSHWREPQHAEFQPRTLWSLQNAFTEALKGHLHLLPGRSERLHQLLDARAGLINR